tara:strand:- start:13024 stop:15174 length:2151 start_codon:yes stop_codon:yes gene_type:complete
MGVSKITKVSVILPRSHVPNAMEQLSKFDYFHAAQPDSSTYDELLADYSKRSFKFYVRISDIIKELELNLNPGVMDVLKSGYKDSSQTIDLERWPDLMNKLEENASSIVDTFENKLKELHSLEDEISTNEANLEAIKLLSNYSIDLDKITKYNLFSVNLSICNTKDVPEIERSFNNAIFTSSSLSSEKSLILVAVQKSDSDNIDKVLRLYESETFSIPEDLPQNPTEANNLIQKSLKEQLNNIQSLKSEINSLCKQNESDIFSYFELSKTLYDSCELIKRTGELKYFAVINGFIPTNLKSSFDNLFTSWIVIYEDVDKYDHHDSNHKDAPILMNNLPITKSFKSVTLNQGSPRYGEFDPTSLIALSFPIFYGMMFGDVGHGLVLLLFGLFLLYRKAPFLKSWGQMFSISGIVAIFFGVLIGEAFGIELHKVIPIASIAHLDFIEHPIIHFIHRSEGHLASIEISALRTFLKISVLMGIVHLTAGNLLSIYNTIKNREYDELAIETIPVFVMFVGFVFLMFSFIGTEFKIDQLFTSQREAPLFFITERFLPGLTTYLTIPIATLSLYSTAALLAGLFVMVIGKPILIITGRAPKESIAMSMLVHLIDGGIEKIAGSLSNILSYTRLAVLLTVHSSLLIVVNLALDLPLFAAIPMFILLNLIVILLEGMIVYIQNLRLHLYEWFSKFYSGSGSEFKVFPGSPNNSTNSHVKLRWKHAN